MRLIEIVRCHIEPLLQAGDSVVDATAGNGHDSLWLAQKVGPSGSVHAFDIQEEALANTAQRLDQAGLADCLHPHHCSHAHMAQHVPAGQKAILFNLGYLPGSSHHIVTQSQSSLEAIRAGLELLQVGGRMAIMAYPAHAGGEEEYRHVRDFLQTLPLGQYTVSLSICHNGSEQAPQLFSIEKQQRKIK